MKRSIKSIGITIILVLSILSIGCANTTGDSSNKNSEITLDKDNAISLDYETKEGYKEIFDAFTDDTIKAKEEYVNKTVKISGEVAVIEKKGGYIIVSIMSKKGTYNAKLYFTDNDDNENKINKLQKRDNDKVGEIITAYGIFEEYGDIQATDVHYLKITNCELV